MPRIIQPRILQHSEECTADVFVAVARFLQPRGYIDIAVLMFGFNIPLPIPFLRQLTY